jgi:alkylation response protein AidB-like acyl-CoA dehydrogenase
VDSRLLQGYIDAYGGDVVKAHQAMAKAKGESKPDAYSVELMKKIADAEVAAAGMPGKIGEQKRAELAVLKRQAGIAGGAPTGGGGVPLPSNASAANLNVGTVYQTARGPAKWTGTGFTPI